MRMWWRASSRSSGSSLDSFKNAAVVQPYQRCLQCRVSWVLA
ncbi:hypothetical protein RSAG8_13503, partial [Rhizoctonia solani AG-8 WAC10335]